MKLIKHKEGYSLCIEETGSNSREFIATTDGMYVKHGLSKENCDEIFGVVDVRKLAREYVDSHPDDFQYTSDEYWNSQVDFKNGFNKAMELNKDKLFTTTNLRVGMINLLYLEKEKDELSDVFKERQFKFVDDFIQSLQEPTEIEVEIEMRKDYLTWKQSDIEKMSDCLVPKLDENGCLILKKK
jgi:hypothetical protein